MRLSREIATLLVGIIDHQVIPSSSSELFLFGSRADSTKKGGDIDLSLVTDSESKKRAQAMRLPLRVALREAAQDQKVDLSIVTAEEKNTHPFFASIEQTVSLKKW